MPPTRAHRNKPELVGSFSPEVSIPCWVTGNSDTQVTFPSETPAGAVRHYPALPYYLIFPHPGEHTTVPDVFGQLASL